RDVPKIRKIPATIVQGRYDAVCPMMSAWALHRAWPEADLRVVPDAGHSAFEPGILSELVEATDRYRGCGDRAGSTAPLPPSESVVRSPREPFARHLLPRGGPAGVALGQHERADELRVLVNAADRSHDAVEIRVAHDAVARSLVELHRDPHRELRIAFEL